MNVDQHAYTREGALADSSDEESRELCWLSLDDGIDELATGGANAPSFLSLYSQVYKLVVSGHGPWLYGRVDKKLLSLCNDAFRSICQTHSQCTNVGEGSATICESKSALRKEDDCDKICFDNAADCDCLERYVQAARTIVSLGRNLDQTFRYLHRRYSKVTDKALFRALAAEHLLSTFWTPQPEHGKEIHSESSAVAADHCANPCEVRGVIEGVNNLSSGVCLHLLKKITNLWEYLRNLSPQCDSVACERDGGSHCHHINSHSELLHDVLKLSQDLNADGRLLHQIVIPTLCHNFREYLADRSVDLSESIQNLIAAVRIPTRQKNACGIVLLNMLDALVLSIVCTYIRAEEKFFAE